MHAYGKDAITQGNIMSFLPENYEAPKQSGGYMKLEEGENKIRILSKPILGWEDWDNNKPVRYAFDNRPKISVNPEKPIRHFWALIVYNYAKDEIQILHIAQSAIRKAIEVLSKDSDWGSPSTYDLKISRKGEGLNTEYSVNPSPHKPISEDMKKKFKEKRINLEALFVNGDPFAIGYDSYTPMIEAPMPKKDEEVDFILDTPTSITEAEFFTLDEYLMDNPTLKANLINYMTTKYGITDIKKMPTTMYKSSLAKAKEAFESKGLAMNGGL